MVSDNTPLSFISDAPKSYLVDLSGDRHARYEVAWKLEDKEPEAIEAEEWIGKKGYAAKGKKCAERGEVKSVRFVEPLIVDEPEEEEEEGDSPVEPANDELEVPVNDGTVAANDEPVATPGPAAVTPSPAVDIPGEDPESPAIEDVPDLPGDLFDEPTLF